MSEKINRPHVGDDARRDFDVVCLVVLAASLSLRVVFCVAGYKIL